MKTVSEVEEIMLAGPEQNFPNIFLTFSRANALQCANSFNKRPDKRNDVETYILEKTGKVILRGGFSAKTLV